MPICFGFFLFLPGRAAADDIYKWVDAQGNTHFVDSPEKIPARYRDESEHREMEAPAAAADQGVDEPDRSEFNPHGGGHRYAPARSSRQSREHSCGRNRDNDIPACRRACLNPHNRQARKDCQQARKQRLEKRRAARKERADRRRVEKRTRCLKRAQDRAEAARCVQRSLPPPTGKVKVIDP